jgi:hypothetical protein
MARVNPCPDTCVVCRQGFVRDACCGAKLFWLTPCSSGADPSPLGLTQGSTSEFGMACRERKRLLSSKSYPVLRERAYGLSRGSISEFGMGCREGNGFPVIRCVQKVCFMISPEIRSQPVSQPQKERMRTNWNAMQYGSASSSSLTWEKDRVRNSSRGRAIAKAPTPNAGHQS